MSRLILLLIFAIWLADPGSMMRPMLGVVPGAGILFGGYLVLVLGVFVWARRAAGRLDNIKRHHALRRFNRMLNWSRGFIPAWLALGVYGPLGWGWTVCTLLGYPPAAAPLHLVLPGLLLGTLPAILAWMGLWWAQYPAETALREQSFLDQLDQDLPVHAPPSLREYMAANVRQQLLFIFLPILLILSLRDLALLTMRAVGWPAGRIAAMEEWIILPAAVIVFIVAPEILRRVLCTRRLADSPLRQRLEGICQRAGLRYRDILLWQTDYSMGNAAVMGLLPQMRYILLSELLLETLNDKEIEAVFAHEVGHIVHRHMAWYIVFFATMALAAVGPGAILDQWMAAHMPRLALPLAWAVAVMAGTFAIFGFLSRRFERQADVFAARMMQSNWGVGHEEPPHGGPAGTSSDGSHVGAYGADVFASALRRVALINNIPVEGRSWCHGSIGRRMRYLQQLSSDPTLTIEFDRHMSRLYASLVLMLVACGTVLALTMQTG